MAKNCLSNFITMDSWAVLRILLVNINILQWFTGETLVSASVFSCVNPLLACNVAWFVTMFAVYSVWLSALFWFNLVHFDRKSLWCCQLCSSGVKCNSFSFLCIRVKNWYVFIGFLLFFFPHLYNIFSDSFKVNPYELRCISNFYVSIIFVTIYKCFIHFIWIYKVNFQMRLPMRLHLVLSGFLLSDSLCKHYRS